MDTLDHTRRSRRSYFNWIYKKTSSHLLLGCFSPINIHLQPPNPPGWLIDWLIDCWIDLSIDDYYYYYYFILILFYSLTPLDSTYYCSCFTDQKQSPSIHQHPEIILPLIIHWFFSPSLTSLTLQIPSPSSYFIFFFSLPVCTKEEEVKTYLPLIFVFYNSFLTFVFNSSSSLLCLPVKPPCFSSVSHSTHTDRLSPSSCLVHLLFRLLHRFATAVWFSRNFPPLSSYYCFSRQNNPEKLRRTGLFFFFPIAGCFNFFGTPPPPFSFRRSPPSARNITTTLWVFPDRVHLDRVSPESCHFFPRSL